MMASESKYKFIIRLFWQKLIFAWQIETAYVGNVVGNLLSTFIYNVTFIIFLDIILKSVDSFGGYTFSDMLVYALVSQVIFYSQSFMTFGSASRLVREVRNGDFDVHILKPISLLFQAMTSALRPFSTLVFAAPSFGLYIWLIIVNTAWHPTVYNLILGSFSLMFGVITLNVYRFTLAIMVFFFKQSKKITKTADITSSIGQFPYGVFKSTAKIIISVLVPFFLAAAIPVEYFLNKTSSLNLFFLQFVICILFIVLLNVFWKKGLKSYNSASS